MPYRKGWRAMASMLALRTEVEELHRLWWEAVWSELAEHGELPVEFALTTRKGWDRFDRVAETLRDAGFDTDVLMAGFEAVGNPDSTSWDVYQALMDKAQRIGGERIRTQPQEA
jgi:hypothetical protein